MLLLQLLRCLLLCQSLNSGLRIRRSLCLRELLSLLLILLLLQLCEARLDLLLLLILGCGGEALARKACRLLIDELEGGCEAALREGVLTLRSTRAAVTTAHSQGVQGVLHSKRQGASARMLAVLAGSRSHHSRAPAIATAANWTLPDRANVAAQLIKWVTVATMPAVISGIGRRRLANAGETGAADLREERAEHARKRIEGRRRGRRLGMPACPILTASEPCVLLLLLLLLLGQSPPTRCRP